MGTKLEDGFKTTIAFASGPSGGSLFWETEVTPPGITAGGLIDTTTMRNEKYRTKATRTLIDLLASSFTAAYDPAIITDLLDMVGVSQLITITFPDAQTLSFYGALNEWTPGALTEGEMPTAEFSIEATNRDSSGAEQAPVIG